MKGTLTRHQLFEQCIIIATLPTLIREAQDVSSHNTSDPRRVTSPEIKTVMEACVKYAHLGLKMMMYLHGQGFLGMSAH